MKLKSILVSSMLLCNASLYAQSGVNLIPLPKQIEYSNSKFSLNKESKILYSKGLEAQAQLLNGLISNATNIDFVVTQSDKASTNSIFLGLDSKIENSEGYTIVVTSKGIQINGKTPDGVAFAIQTLLQLMPEQIFSDRPQKGVEWQVPTLSIEDAPQFAWRGVMLDVGRYFFSKEYVLKFIDMISMYKMNTLHLHLVDDSGWRIESKKYLKLTEIGAFNGEGENRRGGFYTQEELKEIVAYAAARGITVVPELEFPAHLLSAVVAYPWLSCKEEQLKMPDQHYISKDLICVGKESSIKFLEDIIEETCAIFPSKYIHIGGDEAVYDYWDECPKCRKVMEENNFTKSSELQSYLTNIVAKIAKKHGRKIVGWNEIVQRGKVEEQVASMVWQDMADTKQAIDLGHEAVIAPADYLYFDFPEARLPSEMKAAGWKGPISIEKCYSLDLSSYENNKNVLGAHVSMWSDQFIHGTILQELELLDENRSENYINYFMLPRLLAFSELVWCKSDTKDFNSFKHRLLSHYKRLDYAGFNYRVPVPEIVSSEKTANGFLVELSAPINDATIHYTTNGTKPTPFDKLYTGKVEVKQLSDLRAVTALSKTRFSVPSYVEEDYSKYKEYGALVSKISHSTLNSTIEVDLTGKISSDGNYEVTFIPLTDDVNIEIGTLTIFKRDEISAKSEINKSVVTLPIATKVEIKNWQAGTPYSAKVDVKADENRGNIAVFIKKL